MAFFECLVGGDGSTLTVTCYSGFAGLTISITNGVDTFSDVCPSTSPYEVVFEGLANGNWTLSTVYNGVTYTETVEINLVTQFYPTPDGATVTPTYDIQTWLHCADIWDKNYTTIAQVLADASTLQAVIASNNAADYMARSTAWANDVCADANAMTYIGANDYCANALLNNAIWCSAIINSTNMELILNEKVPTMTSNTAPLGEAIGQQSANPSPANWAFYKPFNGSTAADTASVVQCALMVNNGTDYFGYKFTSPVCIKFMQFRNYDYNASDIQAVKTYDILADNGDGNWENLGSFTNDNNVRGGYYSCILNNSNKYLRYIMRLTSVYQTYGLVRNTQFYGRA